MSIEISINEEDLIRECANSPFENIVILALKEVSKTLKNMEERLSFLENKLLEK